MSYCTLHHHALGFKRFMSQRRVDITYVLCKIFLFSSSLRRSFGPKYRLFRDLYVYVHALSPCIPYQLSHFALPLSLRHIK